MYKGSQAPFPAGQGGFNDNRNSFSTPVTDLIQARNIRFDGNTWTKAPGLQSYDVDGITGAPNILEAMQYIPTNGVSRIVTACADGKIYREDAGDLDNNTYVTGLTFTDSITLLSAGDEALANDRILFMFSRGIVPHAVHADGTTLAPLTLIPADWTGSTFPSGAIYHDARVVAFLKHNLYFSTLTAHDDFSTGSPPIISVEPGFGTEIVAALSYLPSLLYVWKYPYGIFRVDTSDINGLIIPVQTVKRDIGGSGPGGVCRVKNDVWFVSSTGHIHSLTAVNNSEATSDSDITAQLNLQIWIQENIDLGKISTVKMAYDETRQEVHVMYTSKNGTGALNDIGLIIDVRDPQTPKVAVEDRGPYFQALFTYRETDNSIQVYCGGKNGLIYRENRVGRSIDNVTPYVASFQYPETDLAYADSKISPKSLNAKSKRFDWLEMFALPTGNYNLIFSIFVDGVLTQTFPMVLGFTGGVLDSFILDTDRLGGGDVVSHKHRLYGRGRRISIQASNSGLNENFMITGLLLHYRAAEMEGTH